MVVTVRLVVFVPCFAKGSGENREPSGPGNFFRSGMVQHLERIFYIGSGSARVVFQPNTFNCRIEQPCEPWLPNQAHPN
jgi:hypothetical protein